MSRPAWFLFAAAIILLACAGFWLANLGQPRPPEIPVSPSATSATIANDIPDLPEKPSLQPLFENLTSTDPALKAAALQQLAQLPPDRRTDLRAYAAQTLLPDLASLLAKRAAEMDDQIALDPPPISLHVQHAGLAEVTSLLASATTSNINASTALSGPGSFSLDADHKPFWNIVTSLAPQSPFWISGSNDRLTFSSSPRNRGILMSSIRGPFCLFTMRLPERPDSLRYALAADPRTLLLGYDLAWTLVDAAGNEYPLPSRPGFTPDKLTPIVDFNCTRNDNLNLASFQSAHPGIAIAAYKVHARLAVGLQIAQTEFKNIEKGPDIPFSLRTPAGTVGTASVTFSLNEMTYSDGHRGTQFDISVRRDNASAWQAFRLRDSSGNIVAAMCTCGGGGRAPIDGTSPFSLQVLVPQQIKYYDLDFELRPQP